MDPSRFSIRDLEQTRVLRSPVRQEIIDTVQSLGVCSVAEIARQLGRHADGLYYHINSLSRVGLLDRAGTRRSQGRTEALYTTRSPKHTMQLHYDPGDPKNVDCVLGVVAGMLRMTERDFANAYRPDAVTEGPERNLWAARIKGWLSDEDLHEVNRLIGELGAIFDRPRAPGRDRLHAFTFVHLAIPARSVRREDE